MSLCRNCSCALTARDVKLYSSQCDFCARAQEEADTAYVEPDPPEIYIEKIKSGED